MNNEFSRRNLLKGIATVGGGALMGQVLSPGRAFAQQTGTAPVPASEDSNLSVRAVLELARERLYPACRVCPVCDGVACSTDSGGIGGTGTSMSFQNNFTALQRVRLVMRNVHDVKKADASTAIFGHKLSFPAVAAPMGPAATKFGKGISMDEWFDALIGGCNLAGTLGSLGDDPRYPADAVKRRLEILKRFNGKALYNSKPAPNPVILKWQPLIEEVGPAWISIDLDSEPKSVSELAELVKAFKTPIVVKGIVTLDDAMRCVDVGIAGIAVSNHGGRRMDHQPGVAEVLPSIAAKLKGKVPILADGCVHSGYDVMKLLGMGADVVMVGRHILRAAYGAGSQGVALFMNKMRSEFEHAMVQTGVSSVSQIRSHVTSIAA